MINNAFLRETYSQYRIKALENELEQFQKEEHANAERLFPGREDCLKRFERPYRSLWERHFGDEDFPLPLVLSFRQTMRFSCRIPNSPSR